MAAERFFKVTLAQKAQKGKIEHFKKVSQEKMNMVLEISPKDAKMAVANGRAIILDVRHKEEVDFSQIPEKFTWIEVQELPMRFTELPKDKEILCLCRTGGRSGGAAEFLNKNGFVAKNIRGGIFEWSKIDNSIKKYVYFFENEKLIVTEI